MLTILFHLLIAAIVIGIIVYVASRFAPAPPNPVGWIIWAIVFIIALIILLPIVGIHIPAFVLLR